MMRASAIVDTNLLVLFIVGRLRPDHVGHHRRLSEFRQQDISILNDALMEFQKFITVPNILSEVSNLLCCGDQEICEGANRLLAEYVSRVEEIYLASEEIVTIPEFFRLGLTDTVLLQIAKKRITTITSDFPLANRLQSLGLPCINFNHLRSPQYGESI